MKAKTILMVAVLAAAGLAQAETVGVSSNTGNIAVGGVSGGVNGHEGNAGDPGIRVVNAGNYAKVVSFPGLTRMATSDSNGVYVVNTSNMPGSHSALGNFNFAKVDSDAAKVYFGEWSNAAGDTASHTVYYAGDNKTTDMPNSGTATYEIAGLNNYNGDNQSFGSFTADFGAKTYDAELYGDNIITMTGNIDTANAAFSGTAQANSQYNGVSQGNFFGANAAAVAGVATFDGRPDLDTAFGGAKQ